MVAGELTVKSPENAPNQTCMKAALLTCVHNVYDSYSLFIIVTFSHPNFVIGTKDTVDMMTDISCCVAGVSVKAVDVNGVEVRFEDVDKSYS